MTRITLLLLCITLSMIAVKAQNTDSITNEKFRFTDKISLQASPVKDQYSSGTCWSYATVSFLESELLRKTGTTYDLSEMFFARNAYEAKAIQYVRMHGKANFGQGGQAHDVMNTVAKYGLVTEQEYNGLANGQKKPEHSELEAVLTAVVEAISKNPNGRLSPEWPKVISSILDIYMGSFPLDNKKKNPISQYIDANDYVEITSYLHHPYYSSFSLEIPDNWSGGVYYNIPLDELIDVIDYSLENGYTICWDGDVSDKGFSHQKGLALLPETNLENLTPTEQSKWEKVNEKDRKQQLYAFEKPVTERIITPEIRQEAFNNYTSTDDHLMHITGTVLDQNGKRYFKVKNSWSSESNKLGGYLYMSENYCRQNSVAIMVHKDAIPTSIKKKLNIK